MSKTEEYIQKIYDFLVVRGVSGATFKEVYGFVRAELGDKVTMNIVYHYVAVMRKEHAFFGFTITPCRKGSDGTGRIFLISSGEDDLFSVDAAVRDHFDAGKHSSLATITQQSSNFAAQIDGYAKKETNPVRRKYLEEVADGAGYVSRTLKRILEGDKAA